MKVKLASVLLALALLASCITACGGSSDSTDPAASTSTESANTNANPEEDGDGDSGAESGSSRESESPPQAISAPDASGGDSSPGSGDGAHAAPTEDTSSDRSKQASRPHRASSKPSDPPTPGFEDASGQTNIPAFGVEAGGGARAAVEAVLGAYLQASREGDWSRACTYLLGSIAAESSALAEGGDAGCAAGLPKVVELSKSSGRDPYFGTAQLSGLRLKAGAGAGFALFHGTDGSDYWVAMKVEGGTWKVLSTIPQPLDPTAR